VRVVGMRRGERERERWVRRESEVGEERERGG
jgi:hypothetical protein